MRNPPLRMQHGTMLGMHEPGGVVGVIQEGVKKNDGWCTYKGLFGIWNGWLACVPKRATLGLKTQKKMCGLISLSTP